MTGKRLYPVISDIIPSSSRTDKCLVLDLDNTLLCTRENEDLSSLNIMNNPKHLKLRNRIYHFELDYPGYENTKFMWGITRPHLTEFLIFCISYFKLVCVWSAGDKPYVEAVVNHIFRDLKRPNIVFTFDDIDELGGYVLKDLNKMMRDPLTLGYMTSKNTITIDDNEFAIRKNIDNAIQIPFYEPSLNTESMSLNDPSLLQITRWLSLNEVVESDDVRKLDKTWIFERTLEEYDKLLKEKEG